MKLFSWRRREINFMTMSWNYFHDGGMKLLRYKTNFKLEGPSLGCAKTIRHVPKGWNLIVCQAIPIPYDPNNMRQLQKFQSDIVLYFPQPMFVYIVNPLVKENRSWQFSKIWLPKVSKCVLKLKNQLFTFPRTFRMKKITWLYWNHCVSTYSKWYISGYSTPYDNHF